MTILTHDLASDSKDPRVVLQASTSALGKISKMDIQFHKFSQDQQANGVYHRHRTGYGKTTRKPHPNHKPFHNIGGSNALDFLFMEMFSFNTSSRHNSAHLYFTPNMFEANGNLLLKATMILDVPVNWDDQGNPTEFHQEALELDRIPMNMCVFGSVATKSTDTSNKVQYDSDLNGEIYGEFVKHL